MIKAVEAYNLALLAGERAKKIDAEINLIEERIRSAANKGIISIHLYKEIFIGSKFDWQPLPEVVDLLKKSGYEYNCSYGCTTVSWKKNL
jgi:hypothetical protein